MKPVLGLKLTFISVLLNLYSIYSLARYSPELYSKQGLLQSLNILLLGLQGKVINVFFHSLCRTLAVEYFRFNTERSISARIHVV